MLKKKTLHPLFFITPDFLYTVVVCASSASTMVNIETKFKDPFQQKILSKSIYIRKKLKVFLYLPRTLLTFTPTIKFFYCHLMLPHMPLKLYVLFQKRQN